MAGELVMTSAQGATLIPDGLLQVGVDKPFEVHRMIPRVYARDTDNSLVDPQPDMELLLALIRAEIENTGLQLRMLKNPMLLSTLVKGSSERTWEFAEPMTITRSNGFNVSLQCATFPAAFTEATITNLLVEIVFEGFLLVVAPPTQNR